MARLQVEGNWNKTFNYMTDLLTIEDRLDVLLNRYGAEGVNLLSKETPKYSGLAASSWDYTIDRSANSIEITWHNYDIEGGYNVAILIQYGHGTRGGTYVAGTDFINPVMQPLFERFADDIYKEVTSL